MDMKHIFENLIKLIIKADSTLTSKGENKKQFVMDMIRSHIPDEQHHLLPIIEVSIDYLVYLMKSGPMIQLQNQCYSRCF